MPRIIVTGADGFIGRALVPDLCALGHQVHAVTSRESPRIAHRQHSLLRWHRCDLLDPAAVKCLVRQVSADHLVHLAWHRPGSWNSDQNNIWISASLKLIERFAQCGGCRVVAAGSAAEYAYTDEPCSEGATSLSALSRYGYCKSTLHVEAKELCDRLDVGLAWGRVFSVFGPWERPDRLVPSVARSLLAGRPALCTEGFQRRDFLHSTDVARAFSLLVESNFVGAINVGSGQHTSIRELVSFIGAELGRGDLIRFGAVADDVVNPALVVADISRLRDDLGFAPTLALREAVTRTVDWWSCQSGEAWA